ncbi:hypothetical protein RJ639_029170 [Escallonia herrerae]|uniref:DUF7788 domain-containing protein n=1 Tax=Escallonia herrerae TaxID=1293975 RepID=A0AA88X766_9ASTE|nr:hypothetical protein RJ639_029170 [Escallonia herrerae]
MTNRLFVFSDMEFDRAPARPWETDYEAICRNFDENESSSVPEIDFWNLRDSKATPVPSQQKGVGTNSHNDEYKVNPGGALEIYSTYEVNGTSYIQKQLDYLCCYKTRE